MINVEELPVVNVNAMRLRGEFIKLINDGYIFDTWEFETTDGGIFSINTRKTNDVDEGVLYDVVVKLTLRYKENRNGFTTNFNEARLISINEIHNRKGEITK